MSDRKNGVLRKPDLNRMINIGILAALMCVATISNRSFLSPGNLLGVLEQNAAKGVMAISPPSPASPSLCFITYLQSCRFSPSSHIRPV